MAKYLLRAQAWAAVVEPEEVYFAAAAGSVAVAASDLLHLLLKRNATLSRS